MLDNARRVLFALSLSAVLLACSSKDDGKAQESSEPEATEATAADTPPAPAAEPPGRKTMMAEHPEKLAADEAEAEGEAGDEAAPASGLVPKVEKLAEKACGCKDKACANGVQDELAKLMGEMKDVQDNERQAVANTMQKLQKCLAEAQQ